MEITKDNLIKLLDAAADEQPGPQWQRAGSYEDVKNKNLVREQGFDLGDLSAAEAQRMVDVVTGAVTEELSDEELELVAGGFNIGMPPTLTKQNVHGLPKGFSFGVEGE